MQESRLFRIVYYLLNRGQATAHELAEIFEVSDRTIYRDIDALSGAGIPIYAEPGRSGGIRLMGSFVLDRAVLSEAEKQEVLAALQSLGSTKDDSSALDKLSALFDVGSESWLEVDFSRWGSERNDNETFEQLKSAILHRQSVRLTYASSRAAIDSRVVHPGKLSYKSRAWYLRAFCTKKRDWRTFKLSRILDLAVLEESFPPLPPPPSEEPAPHESRDVILRFPEELAYRVYDEFSPAQVRRQDGALIAAAPLPVDAWLTGYLLSFGPQVEVLEPAELRTVLADLGKQIWEKNKP